MIARYESAKEFMEIEDDGKITAAGAGDIEDGRLSFYPQTNPPPVEGTGGHELWRSLAQVIPAAKDKPIRLTNRDNGRQYLFLFRASCAIDIFYLGQNFHTGTETYIFLFRVPKNSGDRSEKWRIYNWIKDLH